MEQFVVVPSSVYNSQSLKTLAVAKQNLSKYQAEENSTYRDDSLKKVFKKSCLPKRKIWSIKLCLVLVSSSQIRRFQSWMVCKLEFHCQTLLNNFVVEMQMFQTFTWFYVTLLVYPQIWFWIKKPLPMTEEAGCLSRYERQKLQILYTRGGAAFASAPN